MSFRDSPGNGSILKIHSGRSAEITELRRSGRRYSSIRSCFSEVWEIRRISSRRRCTYLRINAGRSIALKPEGTAGVVRSYIENKVYADTKPAKFCDVIPCFRYEKPQAGRLAGIPSVRHRSLRCRRNMMADAEVIALAMDFFEKLGVGELELRINSIGCPECRAVYRKALQEFLKPHYDAFCDTCKTRYEKNPMRILDCKNPHCNELSEGAPVMIDYLCDDCRQAFEELKANLQALDIGYVVDTGIVRGLDYYTKTAFEIVTNTIGAQGTVCGGGRYDHLVEELGGPKTPGIGFGLGIERLLIVMEATGAYLPEEEGADLRGIYGRRRKDVCPETDSRSEKARF